MAALNDILTDDIPYEQDILQNQYNVSSRARPPPLPGSLPPLYSSAQRLGPNPPPTDPLILFQLSCILWDSPSGTLAATISGLHLGQLCALLGDDLAPSCPPARYS